MRALPLLLALVMIPLTATAGRKTPKHVPGAIVIVLDHSGSMKGSRLDAAKAAAIASVKTLDPSDHVSVIVFDSEATVLVPLQTSRNRKLIEKDVADLESGGGTNIAPALREAFTQLRTSKLARKHVLLMTDGESPSEGIMDLVTEMRTAKLTISTVAVDGADEQLLDDISKRGGGRSYKITDLKTLVPTFVKETQIALK